MTLGRGFCCLRNLQKFRWAHVTLQAGTHSGLIGNQTQEGKP